MDKRDLDYPDQKYSCTSHRGLEDQSNGSALVYCFVTGPTTSHFP